MSPFNKLPRPLSLIGVSVALTVLGFQTRAEDKDSALALVPIGSSTAPFDPSDSPTPQDLEEQDFHPFAENFYDRLGVSKNVSVAELRTRFRKAALLFHPDKAGEASTQAYVRIAEAYEVLSDPERRRRYDLTGNTRQYSWNQPSTQESTEIYGFLRSLFIRIAFSQNPFSRAYASSCLHFWTQLMHLHSIQNLFTEIIEDRLGGTLDLELRFAALYYAAYFIALPRFQVLVMQELKRFPFNALQIQKLLIALQGNLQALGNNELGVRFASALLERLEDPLKRSHDRQVEISIIQESGRFFQWSPRLQARILEETEFARIAGDHSQLAAMETVLRTLKPEQLPLGELKERLKRIYRRSTNPRSLRRWGSADTESVKAVVERLAQWDSSAWEVLGRSFVRSHPPDFRSDSLRKEPQESAPPVDLSSEESVSEHLALMHIGCHDSHDSHGSHGSHEVAVGHTAASGSSILVDAAQRLEEIANLPEGEGTKILAETPSVQAQIIEAHARGVTQVHEVFQRSLAQGLRSFKGVRINCKINLQ